MKLSRYLVSDFSSIVSVLLLDYFNTLFIRHILSSGKECGDVWVK